MRLTITHNFPEVQAALQKAAGQVPYALAVAMNKTAEKVQTNIRKEMVRVFDRPTPWVLRSLRVIRATKSNLKAEISYKDKSLAESSRDYIGPHVDGGERSYKPMELRLQQSGLLPRGWNVVPGSAAKMDGYGNMSRGQISTLLNVLGTYREAGYNKANAATVARLAKGKKGSYGFKYFVSHGKGGRSAINYKNQKVTIQRNHLAPGVYQRIETGFGSAIKPVLMFVKRARYKRRLDFYGVGQRTINQEFPREFDAAFAKALKTSLYKKQGSLL